MVVTPNLHLGKFSQCIREEKVTKHASLKAEFSCYDGT